MLLCELRVYSFAFSVVNCIYRIILFQIVVLRVQRLPDVLYLYQNLCMPRPILLLLALFTISSIPAQTLKKYPISNSGCSVYMYCDVKGFMTDYSDDSSLVFTGECINADVLYGVICVKLLRPTADLSIAEEVMISYLDFLKADFHVRDSTGYGRGHTLPKNANTRGVIDYWTDTEDQHWKIKAWTDGKFIAVLYGHSLKELPESKLNVFLDSFRLPGM